MKSRSRTRGSITGVAGGYYTEKYCNGSTVPGKTNSNVGQGYSVGTIETINDYTEPNFNARRSAGEIMNHPVSIHKIEVGGSNTSSYTVTYTNPAIPCTAGTEFIKNQIGVGHARHLKCDPGLPNGSIFDSLFNLSVLAGTQAKGNVKSPEVQGLVFAAELGKTIAMLGSPLANLRKLLFEIKASSRYSAYKRRMKRGGSFMDFMSREWLRYRYGITPLLHDIDDICKLANTPLLSPRLTARGKAEVDHPPVNEVASEVIPHGDTSWVGGSTRSTKLKATARAGVLYEHEMSLQDRYGYSLEQLTSTAWELVPYSFVVDWLVNVNDWIAAITPKVGVKVLAEWTTTIVEFHGAATAYANPGPAGTYYSISGSLGLSSYRRETFYNRVPLIRVGLVDKVSTLSLGKVRDQKRILDAFTLLLQAARH